MMAPRRPSESLARNCDDDHGDGDDGDNDDDGDGDHDDDDGVNLFVGFTTFNTLLRYENKLLKVRPLSRKVPCCKTCSFGISGVVVGGRGGTTGVSSRDGSASSCIATRTGICIGSGRGGTTPVIVGGVGYGSDYNCQATRI